MKKFREGTPTSEWYSGDVSTSLVNVNLMIPCMDLCALTQIFSKFENKTGSDLFSREGERIIKRFTILACAKSFVTLNDFQFKIVAPFMQSPTSSESTEHTEFAMKTQRVVKEQGTSRRSARGKQVIVESSSESEQQEEVYETKSKSTKGLATDLMHPMQDFTVSLDMKDAENKLWLQKIRLWDYAKIEWERHANNIYAPTQLISLQKGTRMSGTEQEMSVDFFT